MNKENGVLVELDGEQRDDVDEFEGHETEARFRRCRRKGSREDECMDHSRRFCRWRIEVGSRTKRIGQATEVKDRSLRCESEYPSEFRLNSNLNRVLLRHGQFLGRFSEFVVAGVRRSSICLRFPLPESQQLFFEAGLDLGLDWSHIHNGSIHVSMFDQRLKIPGAIDDVRNAKLDTVSSSAPVT